jgi:hypothetical protein
MCKRMCAASRAGELLSEIQFVDVKKKGFEQACFRLFSLTSACRKCKIPANCMLASARRSLPPFLFRFWTRSIARPVLPNPPRGAHL